MSRDVAIERRPAAGPADASRRAGRMFQAVFAQVCAWQARAAERRHIRELDERRLRDVGLTRQDVAEMLGRPFWRR